MNKDECAKMVQDVWENDNYPETDAERVDYAAFALTKSLEVMASAIHRLYHVSKLYSMEAPNIILHNEARIAMRYLDQVKFSVNDSYKEAMEAYKHLTQEADYLKDQNQKIY